MTLTQGPRPGSGAGSGTHARARGDRRRRRGPIRVLFDLIRGLISLLALLALLVGLPALLVVATTTLLPRQLPALDEVTKVLTAPDDGTGFLAALAIVAWVAWLCFAISVIVEIPAQVRGLSAPRIRGLGWSQRAAGALIGGIMLLVPAGTALAAGSAEAAAAPHLPEVAASAPAQPTEQNVPVRVQEPGISAPTHTVQRGDTLWTIAEERLGDGKRWTEIASLNDGKVMKGGTTFDSADYVEAGWVLTLPGNASPPPEVKAAHLPADPGTAPGPGQAARTPLPASVTVKQGDTLSDIAEDLLGDADRYPEIFDANKDKPQADGATLTDPNAIEPGWTLAIPGGGDTAPAQVPPAQAPPAQQPPAAPPTDPEPADRQQPPVVAAPHVAKQDAPTTPTTPAPPHVAKQDALTGPITPAAQPTTPAAPAATPDNGAGETKPVGNEAARTPDDGADDGSSIPVGAIGLGAVGAAAVLGALLVRRRLQQSVRRDGRRIAMPAPAAAGVEQQLRATEAPDALDLFDRTLRTLCARMSDTGRTLPLIDSVQLTDTRLELHLAAPSPPLYPFESVDGDHMHWTCPADAELLHAAAAADVPAPYPALAVLGETDDGRQLLVDLESLGVVGLTDGTGEDNLAVLRALAVELLSNVWSDDLCVTVVGFGRELRDVEREGRQQLRYAYSLDEALGRLATWSDEVVTLLDDAKLTSPRQARTKGILPDTWPPEIVLSLEPLTEAHVEHIQRLTNAYPRAAAAIVAPVHAEPWLSGLGVTRLPTAPGVVTPTRIDSDVVVQRLEDAQYQALVSMFTVSRDMDGVDAEDVLIPGQRVVREPEPVGVGASGMSSAAWSAVDGMERAARSGGTATVTESPADAPAESRPHYQPDPTDPEPDERAIAGNRLHEPPRRGTRPAAADYAPGGVYGPGTNAPAAYGSWGTAAYPVSGAPLAPPERIEPRATAPGDTASLPIPVLPDEPYEPVTPYRPDGSEGFPGSDDEWEYQAEELAPRPERDIDDPAVEGESEAQSDPGEPGQDRPRDFDGDESPDGDERFAAPAAEPHSGSSAGPLAGPVADPVTASGPVTGPDAGSAADPVADELSYEQTAYAQTPYGQQSYGGEAPGTPSFDEPVLDDALFEEPVLGEPPYGDPAVDEQPDFGESTLGATGFDGQARDEPAFDEPVFGAPVGSDAPATAEPPAHGPDSDHPGIATDPAGGFDEVGLEGVDDPENGHPYAPPGAPGVPVAPVPAVEAPDEGTAVPTDSRSTTATQDQDQDQSPDAGGLGGGPGAGAARATHAAAGGDARVRVDAPIGAPGVHVLGPDDEVDLMADGRPRDAAGVEMPSAEYWGPARTADAPTADDSGAYPAVGNDSAAPLSEGREVGSTWDVAPPVAASAGTRIAADAAREPARVPVDGFTPTYPEIRILGQVDLIGVGEEVEHGRRARLTELATWIALHPGRPIAELDAAVWPLGVTATVRNSAVSQLRRWVGTSQDGTSHLPPAVSGGGYRFGPGFACDWFRFRELVGHGLYGNHDVATDYARALDIVRDAPFDGVGPRRYVWAEPFRQQMIAEIVDVAARLAEYHLENQDPQSAKRACSVGLVVCPESQMLYRIMFRATHITGDRAELDYYVDRLDGLLAGLGAEPEPLTVELLRDLLDD